MSHRTEQLRITVADGGTQAVLHVPAQAAELVVAADDILEMAAAAGLVISDAVRARAAEIAAALAGTTGEPAAPGAAAREFRLAEGQPLVEAEDGRLVWAPELAKVLEQPGEDERIDYFSWTRIITVEAGTAFGQIVPPKDGQPGTDVFGRVQQPRRLHGTPLELGPGVNMSESASECLVAAIAGRVVVERGKVQISDVLTIPGDVDLRSGSVDACVDVTVRGTVHTKFKVRTTKSLQVDRVIEAAEIDVGGHLTVGGGIFGQDGEGHIRVGEAVTAKLLNETDLQAGGDVDFRKEVMNSRVHALGRLVGEYGAIIGGAVYAREGIKVRVIGSEACVTTLVATGIHVDTLRRVRQNERQVTELHKSAQQIRDAVQPLMANLKRLLPAQRERATELLSKADEIDTQVEQIQTESRKLLTEGAPRGSPHVLVSEAVYPGTRVTIGGRELRVHHRIVGPVRIEMRKMDDVTEVVAANLRSGSVTILPSNEVDLDAPVAHDTGASGKRDGTYKATAKQHSP